MRQESVHCRICSPHVTKTCPSGRRVLPSASSLCFCPPRLPLFSLLSPHLPPTSALPLAHSPTRPASAPLGQTEPLIPRRPCIVFPSLVQQLSTCPARGRLPAANSYFLPGSSSSLSCEVRDCPHDHIVRNGSHSIHNPTLTPRSTPPHLPTEPRTHHACRLNLLALGERLDQVDPDTATETESRTAGQELDERGTLEEDGRSKEHAHDGSDHGVVVGLDLAAVVRL